MVGDAWFPIGFELPSGSSVGRVLYSGADWQIVDSNNRDRSLICTEELAARWVADHLIEAGTLVSTQFGPVTYHCLTSRSDAILAPVADCRAVRSREDALAFAQAMGLTRAIASTVRMADGIFVEKHSRILPGYSIEEQESDELLLGKWLSGGLPIPAGDVSKFSRTVTWLDRKTIKAVLAAASIPIRDEVYPAPLDGQGRKQLPNESHSAIGSGKRFDLPGRAELETFFNDHVVDIVQNSDRYRALGIDGPSAIILNGPPGCGKTFAVERLVEFLAWPSFEIDASSIASPYIHETSRKIAETFDAAIDAAPAVIVIDEMEAFVGDRSGLGGSNSHRLEELSEFLRRIPQATKAGVLVIGMTNRLDLIDPAILRRGRFDHILSVGFASVAEIEAMLGSMSEKIPKARDVDLSRLAHELDGRPLSDVSFVLREGARLAARSGRSELTQIDLVAALEATGPRGDSASKRIGF
jgi:cell division protease FtsH